MKTYKNIYEEICSINNLARAWKKARKRKTKKDYVIEFEKNLRENLLQLRKELLDDTYKPKPLKNFIVRDPKTRKISKSDFRDRIVHHALCNIIEPIFEKIFIYDSCANRIGKGNLFALKRFKKFMKKVSENGDYMKNKFNDKNFVFGYCLKIDIKHYFQEIDRDILLDILIKKIKDEKVINLIKLILNNFNSEEGMPLGNLTSQFFANVYLNELDYFVKHMLRTKFYIRYVDDFLILHKSKKQLEIWKEQINNFLRENLKIEFHPEKSKIIPLSRGVDFVGFKTFYYFKLLKRRNINKIQKNINEFNNQKMSEKKLKEIFQGWNAYAMWGNSHRLKEVLLNQIIMQLENLY